MITWRTVQTTIMIGEVAGYTTPPPPSPQRTHHHHHHHHQQTEESLFAGKKLDFNASRSNFN